MTNLDSLKRRILTQVPLDTLISEKVKLVSRSGHKVGLCPFHNEKTPSFVVYPDHYYCFGCKVSGDAITYVRQINGMGYIEALKFLSQKYGISAPELKEGKNAIIQQNKDLLYYKILRAAQNIFVNNLNGPEGQVAYQYLIDRGFKPSDIKDFEFGFSLNQPIFLINSLRSLGFLEKDIEACSLAAYSPEKRRYYDFFINRITVPIRDVWGRLVGFGGRVLDDSLPKYKNSREYRLFDKSSILFGFNQAKEHIRKGEPAIVVEGYMDVLRLWQHGFKGATACMGTALKPAHLKNLSRFTNKAILVFDGDSAGEKATLSTVSKGFSAPELLLKVIILPKGEDPDSFLKKFGTDKFNALINTSQDLLSYAIKAKLKNLNQMQVPELVKKEFIPWLSSISDNLQKSYLSSQIAQLTGISMDAIKKEIKYSTNDQLFSENIEESVNILGALEKEFIAHIYYANPGEFDFDSILDFVKKELQIDQIWEVFIDEIIVSLKKGQSPSSMINSEWKAATSKEVIEFIEEIQTVKAAYIVKDRKKSIDKVILNYRKKIRQEYIANLKARIPVASKDELQDILLNISELNKEISFL